MATVALAAVGATGVVLAVTILDAPSQMWSTEWGRALLAKLAFVGAAVAAGAYNHKVLIPALSRRQDEPALTDRFRTIVTAEAAAIVGVAVVTAVLMGAAS